MCYITGFSFLGHDYIMCLFLGARKRDWKRSVFILIPKKGNAKECSNYHTITIISPLVRLCSKSFKLGFSNMWTENFQMYKLGLEKAEETEIKLVTSVASQGKQGNPKKISTSVSLTMLKPLIGWITTNCEKFLKRCKYQDYLTCLLRNLYAG